MKLLITGFEPFLGEKINPSGLLPEKLKADPNVETLLLPVSFQRASAMLLDHVAKHGPFGAVLMLGQAGGRSKVSMERVALNWIETEHPDEDGFKPERGAIDGIEETAFFSEMPLEDWRAEIAALGLPIEISLSAGGYVCNDLYFKMRRDLVGTPCLFVHVPYLPEQAASKNAPYLSIETMFKTVKEIASRII